MISKRSSAERGTTQTDWLRSHHSFSFGNYRDPAWMGFGPLRVINDDYVAGGGGFAPHSHRDMEIITYVLDGAVAHRDSLGTIQTIPAGDIQLMRAGTGIEHSEYNASQDDETHFLQIWIKPRALGLAPAYAQRAVPHTQNAWLCLVSADGKDQSLVMEQDATIDLARLDAGHTLTRPLDKSRGYWLHVASGTITLQGQTWQAGDAAILRDENHLSLTATTDSIVLLFDVVV